MNPIVTPSTSQAAALRMKFLEALLSFDSIIHLLISMFAARTDFETSLISNGRKMFYQTSFPKR
jgi:hypothetical protein